MVILLALNLRWCKDNKCSHLIIIIIMIIIIIIIIIITDLYSAFRSEDTEALEKIQRRLS